MADIEKRVVALETDVLNELKITRTRTRQNTVTGLKQYRILFLDVQLYSVLRHFL